MCCSGDHERGSRWNPSRREATIPAARVRTPRGCGRRAPRGSRRRAPDFFERCDPFFVPQGERKKRAGRAATARSVYARIVTKASEQSPTEEKACLCSPFGSRRSWSLSLVPVRVRPSGLEILFAVWRGRRGLVNAAPGLRDRPRRPRSTLTRRRPGRSAPATQARRHGALLNRGAPAARFRSRRNGSRWSRISPVNCLLGPPRATVGRAVCAGSG